MNTHLVAIPQKTEKTDKKTVFPNKQLVESEVRINNSQFLINAPEGAKVDVTIPLLVNQEKGLAVWVHYPKLNSSELVALICGNEVLVKIESEEKRNESIDKIKKAVEEGSFNGDKNKLDKLLMYAETAPVGGLEFGLEKENNFLIPLYIDPLTKEVFFPNLNEMSVGRGTKYEIRSNNSLKDYSSLDEMKKEVSGVNLTEVERIVSAHGAAYSVDKERPNLQPNCGLDIVNNEVKVLEIVQERVEHIEQLAAGSIKKDTYIETMSRVESNFFDPKMKKESIPYMSAVDKSVSKGSGGFINVDNNFTVIYIRGVERIEDFIKITPLPIIQTDQIVSGQKSKTDAKVDQSKKHIKNEVVEPNIIEEKGNLNKPLCEMARKSSRKKRMRRKISQIDLENVKRKLINFRIARSNKVTPFVKTARLLILKEFDKRKTIAENRTNGKFAQIRKKVERIMLQISAILRLKKQERNVSKSSKTGRRILNKKLNMLVNKLELELLKLLKMKLAGMERLKVAPANKAEIHLWLKKLGLKKEIAFAITTMFAILAKEPKQYEKINEQIKKILESTKKEKLRKIAKIHLLILLLNFYLKSRGTKLRRNRNTVK